MLNEARMSPCPEVSQPDTGGSVLHKTSLTMRVGVYAKSADGKGLLWLGEELQYLESNGRFEQC